MQFLSTPCVGSVMRNNLDNFEVKNVIGKSAYK